MTHCVSAVSDPLTHSVRSAVMKGNHFMKRTTVFGVLILILCLFVTVTAQDGQAESFTSGDWDFVTNDTGVTLIHYHGQDDKIIIPEMLDGKTVTALEKELFKDNDVISSIYIPNSVEKIGSNAFNGCTGLREVRLPQNLKKIESGLFRYCVQLEQIIIPFNVTSIGSNAFADCVHLKEIILIGVTSIGESAFNNCQSLEKVFVSRKLSNVDADAFLDTPWLEAQKGEFVFIGQGILLKYNGRSGDVAVPAGTAAIANAFDGNVIVRSVALPEGLLRISQYAFRGAENLSRINIPQTVTTIGTGAFRSCRSLTSIDLPENIGSIGTFAFRGCEKLTKLTFPSKVTSIENSVCRDCPSLVDVVIPENVTKFHKDAFLDSPNVNIMIVEGSPVEDLLKKAGIAYRYY